MKKLFFRNNFLFFIIFFATSYSVKSQSAAHPNIIVFLVDDMGWQDTSVPFSGTVTDNNKKFYTPNMERLAKEGLIFTDAYAAPVCTPTRVSFITGMNVAHHHVTNWTAPLRDVDADASDDQFNAADWNVNGFSPVTGVNRTVYATAYPQLLKDAGYFTVHVGKAHWGSLGTPGASPYNVGFVVNISGHSAGMPQSYLSENFYGNIPGKNSVNSVPDLEEYYDSGLFLTEALTREAIKSLEYPIARKQPFFLHFGHYAVHTPITADARYFKKYLYAGLDSAEAKFASLIEGMDKSLGDVLDFLDKKGIKNNTVVLFLSDNGGLALAPPRGGEPFIQNKPLRAGKGSVYEGGIRIPFIIRYPQMIKKAGITHTPIIAEDVFPSILELAGIKNYKTVQRIDGKSFVPILNKPSFKDTTRVLLWHYPNNWKKQDIPGTSYFSALRKNNWKLVYHLRNNKAELYDLTADLGEQKDLSSVYPEKTKELIRILGKQLKDFNAPLPYDKITGKKIDYPGGN